MKSKRKNSSSTSTAIISSVCNRRTRPGVQDAARLVALAPISNFVDRWEIASSHYNSMLVAKGGTRLIELDQRREDLANDWGMITTSAAAVTSMTKDQLLNTIIEWKFLKGRPRPLKPLLLSNSEASVISASELAFAAANAIPKRDEKNCSTYHCESDEQTKRQITSAINHLCELKGVGPATASAILCLIRPDHFVFMDDEVIECLLPNKKRGYTLGIYMEVNGRCHEIADELNAARRKKTKVDEVTNDKPPSEEWTNCRVGKAIWACAIMSASNDQDGLSAIFLN